MTSWYTGYVPNWFNRFWQPNPPINPYRSIRPPRKELIIEFLLQKQKMVVSNI